MAPTWSAPFCCRFLWTLENLLQSYDSFYVVTYQQRGVKTFHTSRVMTMHFFLP